MVAHSLELIFRTLNGAGARYLVAGGLAVVAHGFVRFTNDVDLLVDLDEDNCRKTVRALSELGYRPLVPVPLEDFAAASKRRQWIEEKRAVVFQLYSDEHPATRIDLFLEPPLDFEQAFERRFMQDAAAGVAVPFVGLDDLVEMKRRAGRSQDLVDVEKLEALRDSDT